MAGMAENRELALYAKCHIHVSCKSGLPIDLIAFLNSLDQHGHGSQIGADAKSVSAIYSMLPGAFPAMPNLLSLPL